jgi:hypothetical protein
MPSLAEHRTDPEQEMKYRRGYIHGVHEMISAVEPYLTEAQLWELRKWATGPLFAWSGGDGEFFAPPVPSLELHEPTKAS